MKRVLVCTFAITLMSAGWPAAQAVKVVTPEDHDKAMKTISTNARQVPQLLQAGSLSDVKNRYLTIREQFIGVEGFWAAQKNEDAATLARNANAKVDAILKAVDSSDRAAIDAGVRDLVAACAACHTKYREPDPTTPNSFIIKH